MVVGAEFGFTLIFTISAVVPYFLVRCCLVQCGHVPCNCLCKKLVEFTILYYSDLTLSRKDSFMSHSHPTLDRGESHEDLLVIST